MRLSQSEGRPSRSQKNRAASRRAKSARAKAIVAAVDVLESRRLFSGETAAAIPPVLASLAAPSSNAVTLNKYFTNANVPGTVATFDTSLGVITVALTDGATPLTVADFLSYVNDNAYDNTIFHRTAVLAAGTGGSPTDQADIIQGGGYVVNATNITHIGTAAPVDDEYKTELFGDVEGTLAMAKTADANSGTSEWYFNVHDNASALDTPTTDSDGVTTSYTVFGKVLTGMNVVDEIASLPTFNYSSSLNTIPVVGLTEDQVTAGRAITDANLVYTYKITTKSSISYTASSDDPSLVTPSINNGVLSFSYATGKFGTANITVVAKSVDGSSASTTFAVTVPNTTTATTGPIVSAVTAPNVVTGKSGTFSVLTNDTDASAALNQSSVAISTSPAHGTATVNASNGLVTYIPTSGFTGTDTFSYKVTDTAGNVSTPALVTVDVVAAPATVTIGTKSARELDFTESSGVIGHLKITGGTGVITFAGSTVTTTTSAGVITATGADADIAGIVITNTGAGASLSLTSDGAVAIGTVTDVGRLANLDAPEGTLIGNSSFKSLGRLTVAGLSDANLLLGAGASTLIVPSATDSSVISTGSISSLASTQWLSDDGGYYSITTPRLGRLYVTSKFAEALNLTAKGSSISSATVGAASAAWTIAGSLGHATIASPASTFALTATGTIGSLAITGNLTSNVSAGGIGTFIVTGTTTGSNINTTATSGPIGRLVFDGAVATTNITATGGIGSVTAASLGTSNVSAGAISAVVIGGNAETADFTTTGTAGSLQIGRFKVGGDFNGSSISATGSVGPATFSSLSDSTLESSAIKSVIVAGASNGSSITTTGKIESGLQIATVRIGGVFDSSSVSATGGVGAFTALSVKGSQITGNTLASVRVAGITNDGTFQANANFSAGKLGLGRLIFDGAVQGTLISANGSIGSVTAPSLTGSQIYAGVNSAESESAVLPSNASEFIFKSHINKVVLAKTGTAFSNSIISASVLSSLTLGNVNTSNGSISEGLSSTKISSIDAVLVPGGLLDVGPKELKSATTLAAYEKAKGVTLGDFAVDLL